MSIGELFFSTSFPSPLFLTITEHASRHRSCPSLGRSARACYPVHKETTRTYSPSCRKQLFTVNNWYKAITYQSIYTQQVGRSSASVHARSLRASQAAVGHVGRAEVPPARSPIPPLPLTPAHISCFSSDCPSYCQTPSVIPPVPARLPSWWPGSAPAGLMWPQLRHGRVGLGPGLTKPPAAEPGGSRVRAG